MAKQLANYTPAIRPRPRLYKWEDWFDGNYWRLTQGDDFKCTVRSMAVMLRRNAKRLGWVITVNTEDKALVVKRIGRIKTKRKKP